MITSLPASARYLGRVFGGLTLLTVLLTAAVTVAQIPLATPLRLLALAVLLLPLLGAYPLMRRLHARSDEMRQQIHYRACLFGLGLSASVLAVAGVLQAANLLPTLNALLGLVILIGSWGLGLMLADRSLH